MFREIDEDKLLDLLSDCVDTLTPKVLQDLKYYRSQTCVRCYGTCIEEPNIDKMIKTGCITGGYNCRCQDCGCLFAPETGLIIEQGNLAKTKPRQITTIDP